MGCVQGSIVRRWSYINVLCLGVSSSVSSVGGEEGAWFARESEGQPCSQPLVYGVRSLLISISR
jgi:hypothetical protein